jgi:hypothetical protein
MIKIPPIKKALLNLRKFSSRKGVMYTSSVLDVIVLICFLIFIFCPDPIINKFMKERITNTFTKAYPVYSLQLGDIHYDIWKNRLSCDSIMLKRIDSKFILRTSYFSVDGIGWLKLLVPRKFTSAILNNSSIDAQRLFYTFNNAQEELYAGLIHISVPDSLITTDSVEYFPLIEDEQLFSKRKFRQTRFCFNIPKVKISGLDCLSLLNGSKYIARYIEVSDLFADILVNMDKPYDKNSLKPQMPNELLSSMKEIVKVDSLKIVNGYLKYSERFVLRAEPGVITFNKVNVSVNGIANHSTYPDTAVIHANGIFMNSGIMKLQMTIPITAKEFSLHYSGSLTAMDVTKLNVFIEPGEHHRIKSGTLLSAAYDINVKSGRSFGILRAEYKDLSIAVLDKKNGSENGIINRISSFIGKIFVIRGNNMSDEKGNMKIGMIKYLRDPEDYFLQFLWFSLRNGVADVVGFPSK